MVRGLIYSNAPSLLNKGSNKLLPPSPTPVTSPLIDRQPSPLSPPPQATAAAAGMKVQCDVCEAEAAEVYCCADEAALCGSCDRHVHRANRLAGMHHRFSLLHPSSSAQSPPLCDVCKAKRGLLFCQEDRAIFCRDCDVPIHSATALTMKHNRFLLTGLRVSAAPIEAEAVDSHRGGGMRANSSSSSSSSATAAATTNSNSSSISEYLIKMLPGWHVEDFLTDDAAVHALCKVNQRRFLLSFPVV
ncbi:hypothetical protein GW17_00041379 [Ensete ventricosum]|nr:hypothetical protein GW17_00041379 [Ensete ventricosum]